ncbi:hypothetical protein BH10BAC5_BH10BAC5_02440 [soil metagenome]
MKFILIVVILVLLPIISVNAQVENVPLSNPVYSFIKEMSVKGIIHYIDFDANLSKGKIADLLETVEKQDTSLSKVEKKFLKKYKLEFEVGGLDNSNTASLFGHGENFSQKAEGFLSKKLKYLYYIDNPENNFYMSGIATRFSFSRSFKPSDSASNSYDGGLRMSGTLFRHLGYSFSFDKGALGGAEFLQLLTAPDLKHNFKFNENIENVRSFDYTDGYVKYQTYPSEDMRIAVQLGREQIKLGYGYGNSLILSGLGPDMDFLRFNFDYDVFHYTSITASTVGNFSRNNRDDRYTKYFAANAFSVELKNLFDINIEEAMIYSRPLELAYLNPLLFYKFAEMSLQDRDNGTISFGLQTRFMKDVELQGTFFLDENIISNLSDLQKASNKTAYQVGAFIYEPFKLRNLSLVLEYTKIRPYVYSHIDNKNTYTAFGTILGNPIGPNADELYTKARYNFSEWVNGSLEYQFTRKGNNITDSQGKLIRNVGGDEQVPFVDNRDADHAAFLDGNRVNTQTVTLGMNVELIRDIIFEFKYIYRLNDDLTNRSKNDVSFAFFRMNWNY